MPDAGSWQRPGGIAYNSSVANHVGSVRLMTLMTRSRVESGAGEDRAALHARLASGRSHGGQKAHLALEAGNCKMTKRNADTSFLWVQYCVHVFLAAILMPAFCFLVDVLFSSAHPEFERAILSPTFALPILLGVAGGIHWGRTLPPLSSRLIFLPAFLVVLWDVIGIVQSHFYPEGLPRYLLNNYLLPPPYCGGSGCLGEIVVASPLISTVTYTIGSEIGRRFFKKRQSRSLTSQSRS